MYNERIFEVDICRHFRDILYNYFSNLLRGIGNSVIPLAFLCVSVILNIGLDLYFVLVLNQGISGRSGDCNCNIAVYFGIGLMIYVYIRYPGNFDLKYEDTKFVKRTAYDIAILSGMTCLQQSVMNFGILMVQGIVNSFGTQIMAAFAVSVKIDTIAYICLYRISEMRFRLLSHKISVRASMTE